MKAKIIKTGEIVEVYHESQHGQTTNIYKEAVLLNGRMWDEDELDFSINSKSKNVDLEKELKNLIGNVGQCDRNLAKHFFELGLKAQK